MNRLKKINPAKAIIILLIAFLFTQCMHDEFQLDKLITEVEVEVGFFSPVAYGSMTISDLTNDLDSTEGLHTYPDGLLYFSFTDSLLSYISEDVLTVPDQDFFQFFLEADFPFPPLWDTTSVDSTNNFPFIFNKGEKIDSIYLDAGTMVFNISSDFRHTGLIVISCPTIRLDGVPFSRTIIIDDPSGTFSTDQQYPLDGYVIELKDSTDCDSVFLPVDFHVELYREGMNPVNIGDQIEIIATITNLDFEAVFGYIGQYELLNYSGSIDLPVFENNFLEGTIGLEDPQMNLIVQNSFGVPVDATINRFTGFDADNDSITLDLEANPYSFDFPSLAEYGETKETVWSINGTNSNLPEFLEFLPSSLTYNISAISNPDGQDPDYYNFVMDASRIDVNLELILPIWFNTNSLAYMDTMDLNMTDIGDNSEFIKQVNVLLEITNGLPIDIEFQLYFTDSLYNHVDTLFAPTQQPIILAGQLDENDVVEYPRMKTTLIQFTGDEIEKFENVYYAIVRAGLKTADYDLGTSVKIYDFYTIDINVSIDADLKVNSNDLD